MPDDLYDRDIVIWSKRQADALRRVAASARANDVDWENVIEEIEGVGVSETNAVHALCYQLLVHLLKMRSWPAARDVGHWRAEAMAFRAQAARRWAPSMRRKLDIQDIYAGAAAQLRATTYEGSSPPPPPDACPVALDDLVGAPLADLEAAFASAR